MDDDYGLKLIGNNFGYGPEWDELRRSLLKRLIVADAWGVTAVAIDRQELLDLMATIELTLNPRPSVKYAFQ
jgi:hypothetical protein